MEPYGVVSGDAVKLHYGQRVWLPGETGIVTVKGSNAIGDKTEVIVSDPDKGLREVLFSAGQLRHVRPVTEDGAARPEVVLAGLWAERMLASVRSATSTVLASSVLRHYPHHKSGGQHPAKACSPFRPVRVLAVSVLGSLEGCRRVFWTTRRA